MNKYLIFKSFFVFESFKENEGLELQFDFVY